MITCPKCFKENQDHYKFCLGCGAELPRDASPKKFAAGTPPHGVPVQARGPVAHQIVDETTTLGTGNAGVPDAGFSANARPQGAAPAARPRSA
ncbi:MAG TPA: hypothetical protein VHB21_21455, partial [Minicystis sp.]|nr:hypothetical protein [Minicystis sp.]